MSRISRLFIGTLAVLSMMAGAALAEITDTASLEFEAVTAHAVEFAPPDVMQIDTQMVATVNDVPCFPVSELTEQKNPDVSQPIMLTSLHTTTPGHALSGGDGYAHLV